MAKETPLISYEVGIATADLISQTANIELTLNIIIWGLLDVPPEYGRPISARLDIRPKTEIITSLLRRRKKDRERFVRYVKRLKSIVKIRNEIVHGAMWIHYSDPDRLGLVLSRGEGIGPYNFAVKEVPLEEIQKAGNRAAKLNADMARFFLRLKPLHRKPRELSQTKKPSPASNRRQKKKKARQRQPPSSRP